MQRRAWGSLGLGFLLTCGAALLADCGGDDNQSAPGSGGDGGVDATTPAPSNDAGTDAAPTPEEGGSLPPPPDDDAGPCPGCLLIASSLNDPSAIAANDSYVYWFSAGGGGYPNVGAVWRAPVGGGPASLVANGFASAGSIALDSQYLYVTSSSAVVQAPLDGDGGTKFYAGSAFAFANFLAVDASYVYWLSIPTPGDGGAAGPSAIVKLALGDYGGTPTPIVSGLTNSVYGLVIDATNVYWSELDSNQHGLVRAAPLTGVADGGAPVTLASGIGVPTALAVNANGVYWTTLEGSVQATPLGGTPDGGAPRTLAAFGSANGLAVDQTNAYFTTWTSNYTNGYLMTAPLSGTWDGGVPTTLALQQVEPAAVALNGTTVFWLDSDQNPTTTVSGDAGTVMAVAKPQ